MKHLPNLLSEIEAAAYLGLAPKTFQRRRWAGLPPSYIKLGSRVLYRIEDLNTFIERGRVQR